MPEFLVRVDGVSKYVRIIARDVSEIESVLEEHWMQAIVFSISGQAFNLEPGKVWMPSRRGLPFSVRLAWLGVRFPRVRLAFQISCWFALGISLGIAREAAPPALLVLTGLANVVAWWWSESDRARIEPGLRQARES